MSLDKQVISKQKKTPLGTKYKIQFTTTAPGMPEIYQDLGVWRFDTPKQAEDYAASVLAPVGLVMRARVVETVDSVVSTFEIKDRRLVPVTGRT